MKTEFTRFLSSDGLRLEGLFMEPDDGCEESIIHVHGLAGNFYEHVFLDQIAKRAVDLGIGMFTFNNRGHDYMADVPRIRGGEVESELIGGAYESFEESKHDIAGAIDVLKERFQCKRLILQGHSIGANKVMNYLISDQADDVAAVILASAADVIAEQRMISGERAGEITELARQLKDKGEGAELLPSDSFVYPISANTYLDYFQKNGVADIFNFEEKKLRGARIVNEMDIPVLAFYGTENEAVMGDPREALEFMRQNYGENCRTAIIEGASHNYQGHEDQVAHIVGKWMEESL